MELPRVSILLTTRNRAEFLAHTVPAILTQTFKNFELVIIDDGSTDKTQEVIRRLVANDHRVVALSNEKSLGISTSLNKALAQARGEYGAIADDDDPWIDPRRLEKQVAFLDAHPDYVAVGGGMVVVDRAGKEILRYLKPETDEAIRRGMFFSNPMANPTTVFRMTAARSIGLYDESVIHGADRDFWMRMGQKGKLYNIPEYFSQYTIAGQNTLFREVPTVFRTSIRLVYKYRKLYPGYGAGMAFVCAQFAYSLVPAAIRQRLNISLFRLKRKMFDVVK
jgi:glycosyltransferase involved in cell wall biosynthesis